MNLSLLVIISSNSFLKAAWLWINSQSSSDSRYLFLRHYSTTFSHWSENRATRAGHEWKPPYDVTPFSSCVVLRCSRSWTWVRRCGRARRRCSWCRCRRWAWRRHERRSEPTASPTRRASRAENPSSPGGDARVQPGLVAFFTGILGTDKSRNNWWQTHNSEGKHRLVDCYSVTCMSSQ